MRGLSEERTADLPFPFDRVWDAARRVFEKEGWVLRKADRAVGRYEAMVGIPSDRLPSLSSSIEKFQVDIARIDENSTRVHAAIRLEEWHWGTTAWHVNTFFAELQKKLVS